MLKFGFKKGRHEKGIKDFPFSLKPLALSLIPLALSFFFCLLNVNTAFAANVQLSWVAPTTNNDNTPLTDLAGYKVYYRTASSSYSQGTDVSNTLTYTFNNLTDGVTYYFTVTAYNTAGDESGYSNEQCFNSTGICSSSSGGNGGGGNQTLQTTGGSSEISGGGCGIVKGSRGKSSGASTSNSLLRAYDLSIAMLLLLLIHLKLRKKFSMKHRFDINNIWCKIGNINWR